MLAPRRLFILAGLTVLHSVPRFVGRKSLVVHFPLKSSFVRLQFALGMKGFFFSGRSRDKVVSTKVIGFFPRASFGRCSEDNAPNLPHVHREVEKS